MATVDTKFILSYPFLVDLFVKKNPEEARTYLRKVCKKFTSASCIMQTTNFMIKYPDSAWSPMNKTLKSDFIWAYKDTVKQFLGRNLQLVTEAILREIPWIAGEIIRNQTELAKKFVTKPRMVRQVVNRTPKISGQFMAQIPALGRQWVDKHQDKRDKFFKWYPEFQANGKPAFDTYEERIRRNYSARLWDKTRYLDIFRAAVCQADLQIDFWLNVSTLYDFSVQKSSSYYGFQAHKFMMFLITFLKPKGVWMVPTAAKKVVENLQRRVCEITKPPRTDEILEIIGRLQSDYLVPPRIDLKNLDPCPEEQWNESLRGLMLKVKPWLHYSSNETDRISLKVS